MTEFTPISALIGGVLIGSAAALLLIFNGRIAGISGIVAGLVQRNRHEFGWRAAFISGVTLAPFFYGALAGHLPKISISSSAGLITIAGLLVGFGTRLGSGCTSGHGVCGISRGSARSLIATGMFLIAAMITLFIKKHIIGN